MSLENKEYIPNDLVILQVTDFLSVGKDVYLR